MIAAALAEYERALHACETLQDELFDDVTHAGVSPETPLPLPPRMPSSIPVYDAERETVPVLGSGLRRKCGEWASRMRPDRTGGCP